ncbi:MAG: LamG domain-containing protein, partial [Chloroflexi bacterium]
MNNRINLTSGIIYDIKLSDGTHYKCDEGAGTTCYDSSGNGRHGTLVNITESSFHTTDNTIFSYQNNYGYSEGTGGVLVPRNEANPTQDVLGNTLQYSGRVKYNADLVQSACATFDGANDYADLPAPPFDANGTSWTVGCWFNTTDDLWRFIDWRGTGSIKRGVQLSGYVPSGNFNNTRIDDGVANFIKFDDVPIDPYVDGNWHHIALSWDSATGTAYLYLDGILASSKSNSNLVNADLTSQPGVWRLGAASNDGSQQLQGSACGFFFYDRLLSASEIAELYNTGFVSGVTPAAYYPCSEGIGSTLYDVSGNNLHATLYNISESSFWGGTQDVFHYNIDKGFSLYQHTTNNDLRVPYDLNGQPLSI